MVEWLVLWGVVQGAGILVAPILGDLAKDGAKDFVKDFFKDSLKKVLLKEKDPRVVATGKALKEFLQIVQKQLKFRCKLSDAEIQPYIKAVKKFISHKEVKEILAQAFQAECESLDASTLKKTWNSLQLKPLPLDFDWEAVTSQYLIQVQEILWESQDLRNILDSQNIQNIATGIENISGITTDFDLEKYQEAIRESYANLKLDSLDTSGAAYNELRLWQIFIPQDVREVHQVLPQVYELPKEHQKRLRENEQIDADISLEELERRKKLYIEQPLRSVNEIIQDKDNYKYIVFLGDPGSGKSTLLQFLALDWVEKTLDRKSFDLPIPLLIELRTYIRRRENQECQSFLNFFHKASGAIAHLNQQQLHAQLKAGNALVMFDGLDEVFDSGLREDVTTDIHRFTNDYPNVQAIVTSRVIGYKAQRLRDAGFTHFMLQDLEQTQVQDFVNRWHNLTFHDEADKIRKQKRLQRAIQESKAIAELAGNPLLLTMMAILNRNQELPRDRAELYHQASRVLLHQWDVERALIEDKRIDPKTIDYKDKQAMLRQVAYFMQTSDKGLAGNLIRENDLERILTDYLQTIEGNDAKKAARVMIHQLRTRNFMLCFLGADYYAFVHRTFLEYFCAWAFIWQFEKERKISLEELKTEVFGKHWQDETWHEVLRLIVGMIEPQFAGEIIDYLIQKDGEEEKYTNIFLAVDCLGEVRNRSAIASTANLLLNEVKRLTQYDLWYYYESVDDEAELVHQIRTKAVASVATTWSDRNTLLWLKACTTTSDWRVRAAAVQALAQAFKDDPETLPWLKASAINNDDSDVRAAALQAIAHSYKDDPQTLPWLKDCAKASDLEVQAAALRELARGFKYDSETLIILKTAVNADDWRVRTVALQELARGFKDDPNTLTILKVNVSADSWKVRATALRELARGFKHDFNTLTILKTAATDDKELDVRAEAVQELARGFKDDPDTLTILKNVAINDAWKIRAIALRELAHMFKDDPQTLSWLKTRATTDRDLDVRAIAFQELAHTYKDDPQILPWLKACATRKDGLDMRAEAVQELARVYKDDPDTLIILKTSATADDWKIRVVALRGLAREFKDDPDTLTILKASAQTDDSDVRAVALQELARGFKHDPDILNILKDCTSSDDSNVQKVALRELARGFKHDPDILNILKDCAGSDDSNVQKAALRELARGFKMEVLTLE